MLDVTRVTMPVLEPLLNKSLSNEISDSEKEDSVSDRLFEYTDTC